MFGVQRKIGIEIGLPILRIIFPRGDILDVFALKAALRDGG